MSAIENILERAELCAERGQLHVAKRALDEIDNRLRAGVPASMNTINRINALSQDLVDVDSGRPRLTTTMF